MPLPRLAKATTSTIKLALSPLLATTLPVRRPLESLPPLISRPHLAPLKADIQIRITALELLLLAIIVILILGAIVAAAASLVELPSYLRGWTRAGSWFNGLMGRGKRWGGVEEGEGGKEEAEGLLGVKTKLARGVERTREGIAGGLGALKKMGVPGGVVDAGGEARRRSSVRKPARAMDV